MAASPDAVNTKKAREAALFSSLAGPLGYLVWGWRQALAALAAAWGAVLLVGAVLQGFDYGFALGWGKWALWAALAGYHWRLAAREAQAQALCAQALAEHGWATDADRTAVERERLRHLVRVVLCELGLVSFGALALGALMAFDGDDAVVRAFVASSLDGKAALLLGVYGGLAIICAVALFGWVNITAALDRLFQRQLQAVLKDQ